MVDYNEVVSWTADYILSWLTLLVPWVTLGTIIWAIYVGTYRVNLNFHILGDCGRLTVANSVSWWVDVACMNSSSTHPCITETAGTQWVNWCSLYSCNSSDDFKLQVAFYFIEGQDYKLCSTVKSGSFCACWFSAAVSTAVYIFITGRSF